MARMSPCHKAAAATVGLLTFLLRDDSQGACGRYEGLRLSQIKPRFAGVGDGHSSAIVVADFAASKKKKKKIC